MHKNERKVVRSAHHELLRAKRGSGAGGAHQDRRRRKERKNRAAWKRGEER